VEVEVGVRDLKNNLSRYLDGVEEGVAVLVTDRGRPVARITPIGVERTIDSLIAQGIVTRASLGKQPAPTRRIRARQPVSPLVGDQRR
jgi:prevent-host-death family protein